MDDETFKWMKRLRKRPEPPTGPDRTPSWAQQNLIDAGVGRIGEWRREPKPDEPTTPMFGLTFKGQQLLDAERRWRFDNHILMRILRAVWPLISAILLFLFGLWTGRSPSFFSDSPSGDQLRACEAECEHVRPEKQESDEARRQHEQQSDTREQSHPPLVVHVEKGELKSGLLLELGQAEADDAEPNADEQPGANCDDGMDGHPAD